MRFVLLLLAACDEPPDEVRVSEATPWGYEPGADAEPPDDPDVLAADVQALFDHGRTWRAAPLIRSFEAASTYAGETCPAGGRIDDGPEGDAAWWYGACTTEERVHFNGAMTSWAWDGHPVGDYQLVDLSGRVPKGYAYKGGGFEGRIDIFDEESDFDFSCSCMGASAEGIRDDGSKVWFDLVRGPASWTGAEAAGSWLEETHVRPMVWQTYRSEPTEPGVLHYRFEAEVSGVGERYRTSRGWFEVVGTTDTSPQCDSLMGHFSIRDVLTADWLEIDLKQRGPGSCEACFPVEGGERCVDVSGSLAEGVRPW